MDDDPPGPDFLRLEGERKLKTYPLVTNITYFGYRLLKLNVPSKSFPNTK